MLIYLHRRVAFLPFVSLCLKTGRPKPYPENPVTLGEHLKKRRIEQGLFQRQAAERLGIDHFTYITWETGKSTPYTHSFAGIIAFLGAGDIEEVADEFTRRVKGLRAPSPAAV